MPLIAAQRREGGSMSNWDMFHLNVPDPQEAVQKHRDVHEGHRGIVTLERALVYLAIIAGISSLPIIAIFVLAARAA